MARANENYRDLKGDEDAEIRSDQIRALVQSVAEVLEIIQNELRDEIPQFKRTK
jgi:hypothetical protein